MICHEVIVYVLDSKCKSRQHQFWKLQACYILLSKFNILIEKSYKWLVVSFEKTR